MDIGLMTLAFLSAPGPMEIAVVLVIVLVVFGPGKLPEVFKALGNGLRQFKEASNSLTSTASTPEVKPPSTPTIAQPEQTPAPAEQNV
jgi:TatA/E family protein of Tat protein translocase